MKPVLIHGMLWKNKNRCRNMLNEVCSVSFISVIEMIHNQPACFSSAGNSRVDDP